jgi:hypothetical protein
MTENKQSDINSLKTLVDSLEAALSKTPADVQAADSLLNTIKTEILILAQPSEADRAVLSEIDSLKTEGERLHERLALMEKILPGKKPRIRRRREKQTKLKQQIAKIEDRIARLSFQMMTNVNPSLEITKRRTARLETELNTLKRHKLVFGKLNWELLPSDKGLLLAIKSVLIGRVQNSGAKVDFERVSRIIETFKPIQCFVGTNEFDGYFVFLMKDSNKAICDNPLFGNAVYIIDGDWKGLSQKSKRELLDYHRVNVRRVIHTGNWIARIRQIL